MHRLNQVVKDRFNKIKPAGSTFTVKTIEKVDSYTREVRIIVTTEKRYDTDNGVVVQPVSMELYARVVEELEGYHVKFLTGADLATGLPFTRRFMYQLLYQNAVYSLGEELIRI